MNSNNKDSLPNPLALDHSQSSVVKLEEYYENIGDNQEPNNSDKENFEVDPEREEMENDYELMKNLNSLKERNQKLESINKYQSIKINRFIGILIYCFYIPVFFIIFLSCGIHNIKN